LKSPDGRTTRALNQYGETSSSVCMIFSIIEPFSRNGCASRTALSVRCTW